ncbi:DUF1642 domain-containing protein [Enterococcus thailandicus]|uniref:DUF1642 domain-containing protein n=1 Tax=Enterococcus thailandicus TaxID=417368 RepID=UPI00288EF5EE|nr:DUF1642 domain-containing protein [Enterococcus thailandicus]MDT2794276.1 DUF1642 domain-containing protein [Enterococcus thailandicus]
MNKQELIEKVIENGAWCTENHTGETDRYVKISKVRELIRLLDEPRKPVVPKFVADWFEEHKDDLEWSIWKLTIDSNTNYTKDKKEMRHWIQHAPNKPYRTLIAMLDGYDVEKEPLYYVVFDILQSQKYLVKNIKTETFYLSNNENVIGNYEQVSFTETEIKAIDERYWAFAVPVEEVVEG